MNFYAKAILLVVSLALVCFLSGAANASSFTVTKTADSDDGACDTDCSLREAIAAANSASSDDIIAFDQGVFATTQTITLNGTQLTVANNGSLVINGPGAQLLSLSGNGVSRVLEIGLNATATLNALTITNGKVVFNSAGGGILNRGTLTINDSTISNNSADTWNGGGIYNDGPGKVLNVNRSTVTGNIGTGAGIYNSIGTVNIVDSHIDENSGSNGTGVFNSGGNLTLISSTVSRNSAAGSGGIGGGILNVGGTITASNVEINGNSASNNGGAGIWNDQGSINLSNSLIRGNTTPGDGGGMVIENGTVTLENTRFIENMASSESSRGGALFASGYSFGSFANVTLRNVTMIGNLAGGGGAICIEVGATLSAERSTLARNIGNQVGGGIYAANGTLNLLNTTVAHNSTTAPNGNAGGIFIVDTAVNLANATIAKNTTAGEGGGIYIWPNMTTGTLNSRNSIIADNTSVTSLVHDLGGNLVSEGYNLIEVTDGTSITGDQTGNIYDVDPRLVPLRDNGGETMTLGLRRESPAIDAGDPTAFPETDQRGIKRPQDGNGDGQPRSDIGAVERRPFENFPLSPFDYDGDGVSDYSVWRPSDGTWYLALSGSAQMHVRPWGLAGDKIAPADYDGDGRTDICVYRPDADGSGQSGWYVIYSETGATDAVPFGLAGDLPAPGDYDADGKADFAVWRPSDGTWYLRLSGSPVMWVLQWGLDGDKPVPADFDGDGRTELAVWRPAEGRWYIANLGTGAIGTFDWGLAGDIPAAGDYSGDGKADHAVYRPSDQTWYRLHTDDFSTPVRQWGLPGDIPAPGDYDGDGKLDIAVYRPSEGRWYAWTAAGVPLSQQFGLDGDMPTESAYIH